MNKRPAIYHKRKLLRFLLCAAFLAVFFPLSGGQDDPLREWVVVIDPGHGGKDPGALGTIAHEKDIVLNIALKLGKYIEENIEGVKVLYTRQEDIFPELWKSAEIANKNKADLFISIHANSFPNSRSVQGTETYIMGHTKDAQNLEVAKKENSVITLEEDYTTKYEGFDPNSTESYIIFSLMQSAYQEQSLQFAGYVQDQFRDRARRVDRGVKQAGFLVLYKTSMPSVLIETGYITNSREEAYLNSDEGQAYIASAIYRAFKNYKQDIERKSDFSVQKGDPLSSATASLKQHDVPFPEEQSGENVTFMVQIASSRKPVGVEPARFKGLENVREIRSGNLFKYASGSSDSYEEILEVKEDLKKLFPDAFIIAVHNNQVIPLQEALKIKEKTKRKNP